MVRKSKSKTKSSKKVSKRKTAKKSVKRKVFKRNPSPRGEALAAQYEYNMELMRGPQIPVWLSEDDSDEGDKLKQKIRNDWYKKHGFKNSRDYANFVEKTLEERRSKWKK